MNPGLCLTCEDKTDRLLVAKDVIGVIVLENCSGSVLTILTVLNLLPILTILTVLSMLAVLTTIGTNLIAKTLGIAVFLEAVHLLHSAKVLIIVRRYLDGPDTSSLRASSIASSPARTALSASLS